MWIELHVAVVVCIDFVRSGLLLSLTVSLNGVCGDNNGDDCGFGIHSLFSTFFAHDVC